LEARRDITCQSIERGSIQQYPPWNDRPIQRTRLYCSKRGSEYWLDDFTGVLFRLPIVAIAEENEREPAMSSIFSRRTFVSGALSGAVIAGTNETKAFAQSDTSARGTGEILIALAGYGPATTSFSLALKRITDELKRVYGDRVRTEILYDIMDEGYLMEDIVGLVESGKYTLGYQSSSFFSDKIPELSIADLPFLFSDSASARSAIDGALGRAMTKRIEKNTNLRVLGYFENGFRQISNSLRPVHSPADLAGMTIRTLPSDIQEQTFRLLGAKPVDIDLSELLDAVKSGKLQAEENPFSNMVTYGIPRYHRYYTASNHFYVSRPIFVHRPTFDAWPEDFQKTLSSAVAAVVQSQRLDHDREEDEAIGTIQKSGGQVLHLTESERSMFVTAVKPLYDDAKTRFGPDLRDAAGIRT
jgi:TRAP-type transport system periplasmic protein